MLSLLLPFQPDSNIRCIQTSFLALIIVIVGYVIPASATRNTLLNRPDSLNSTDAFEQLAGILRSEGATVSSSLRLSTGTVRGIAASHDLAKGETLLVVPPRLILSGATVTRNGAGCAVSRLLAECDAQDVRKTDDCKVLLPGRHEIWSKDLAGKDLELAAFLVQSFHDLKSSKRNSSESQATWPVCEAGVFPANFIEHYLKTLPSWEALQGLPVFSAGQPQCRKVLNGTWVAHFAEGQRAQWAEQWAVLVKRVPDMKHFSVDDFFYAQALIMTRTFGMRANRGAQLEPVLVPLGDMLNEDERKKPGVLWEDVNVSQRGFHLTSTQHAPSGDELFTTYGRKPNFVMYLTYGFFFDDHPMELVPLKLRPFPSETSTAVAGRVDSLLKGIPSFVELSFEATELHLPSILAFARAMALAGDNTSLTPGWRPSEEPLPLRLERRALELLHGHVEAQMRMRSGQDAVDMLGKPFKLASSSASCERYARLNNEPYGALLDFAEEGRQILDLRIGSTSLSAGASHSVHSAATPLRKKWATQLVQRWSRQVNPANKEPKTVRGTQKSLRTVFLGV